MTGSLRADGKVYGLEKVPPAIPYQRALILFQDAKETLVLQSRFDTGGQTATNANFGWVVPVPAVPNLASMNGNEAASTFSGLAFTTSPQVTIVSTWLVLLAFLVSILGCLTSLPLLLASCFLPRLAALLKPRLRYVSLTFLCVTGLLFAVLCLRGIGTAGGPLVDVINSADVGIYSTKVIKASSSADLIQWLNENGYQFQAADAPVINRYIQDGWCFVVAKVRPGERVTATDGLIDPLILRFASSHLVYPLALTSTIGRETEVLLYLFSDYKMQCANRLPLRFAGALSSDLNVRFRTNEPDSFTGWETNLTHLCKFRGRLKPEQMKEDLVFTTAPDNNPYREHIIKW
jgi:hypothetical protein